MARKREHFTKSLERGLKILQVFSCEDTHLTLTHLAERVGLRIAVVQRYTDTLLHLGFLKRNKHKEFFLGPNVLSLGFAYLNGSQLKKMAESLLSDLSEKVNRNVNLGVLDGNEVIYIFRKESRTFIKLDLYAGSKMPAYCTSMGKVLLASLEDKELWSLILSMHFEKVTNRTIIDPAKLWDDLMETRKRGYAICDRELSMDLYAMALPLINREGRVVAAVNLSLSADEAEGEFLNQMLDQLISVGHELSISLGYRGKYPAIPPVSSISESTF